MDAFTAIFTPFVASAAEPTVSPVDEARTKQNFNGFYCVIA